MSTNNPDNSRFQKKTVVKFIGNTPNKNNKNDIQTNNMTPLKKAMMKHKFTPTSSEKKPTKLHALTSKPLPLELTSHLQLQHDAILRTPSKNIKTNNSTGSFDNNNNSKNNEYDNNNTNDDNDYDDLNITCLIDTPNDIKPHKVNKSKPHNTAAVLFTPTRSIKKSRKSAHQNQSNAQQQQQQQYDNLGGYMTQSNIIYDKNNQSNLVKSTKRLDDRRSTLFDLDNTQDSLDLLYQEAEEMSKPYTKVKNKNKMDDLDDEFDEDLRAFTEFDHNFDTFTVKIDSKLLQNNYNGYGNDNHSNNSTLDDYSDDNSDISHSNIIITQKNNQNSENSHQGDTFDWYKPYQSTIKKKLQDDFANPSSHHTKSNTNRLQSTTHDKQQPLPPQQQHHHHHHQRQQQQQQQQQQQRYSNPNKQFNNHPKNAHPTNSSIINNNNNTNNIKMDIFDPFTKDAMAESTVDIMNFVFNPNNYPKHLLPNTLLRDQIDPTAADDEDDMMSTQFFVNNNNYNQLENKGNSNNLTQNTKFTMQTTSIPSTHTHAHKLYQQKTTSQVVGDNYDDIDDEFNDDFLGENSLINQMTQKLKPSMLKPSSTTTTLSRVNEFSTDGNVQNRRPLSKVDQLKLSKIQHQKETAIIDESDFKPINPTQLLKQENVNSIHYITTGNNPQQHVKNNASDIKSNKNNNSTNGDNDHSYNTRNNMNLYDEFYTENDHISTFATKSKRRKSLAAALLSQLTDPVHEHNVNGGDHDDDSDTDNNTNNKNHYIINDNYHLDEGSTWVGKNKRDKMQRDNESLQMQRNQGLQIPQRPKGQKQLNINKKNVNQNGICDDNYNSSSDIDLIDNDNNDYNFNNIIASAKNHKESTNLHTTRVRNNNTSIGVQNQLDDPFLQNIKATFNAMGGLESIASLYMFACTQMNNNTNFNQQDSILPQPLTDFSTFISPSFTIPFLQLGAIIFQPTPITITTSFFNLLFDSLIYSIITIPPHQLSILTGGATPSPGSNVITSNYNVDTDLSRLTRLVNDVYIFLRTDAQNSAYTLSSSSTTTTTNTTNSYGDNDQINKDIADNTNPFLNEKIKLINLNQNDSRFTILNVCLSLFTYIYEISTTNIAKSQHINAPPKMAHMLLKSQLVNIVQVFVDFAKVLIKIHKIDPVQLQISPDLINSSTTIDYQWYKQPTIVLVQKFGEVINNMDGTMIDFVQIAQNICQITPKITQLFPKPQVKGSSYRHSISSMRSYTSSKGGGDVVIKGTQTTIGNNNIKVAKKNDNHTHLDNQKGNDKDKNNTNNNTINNHNNINNHSNINSNHNNTHQLSNSVSSKPQYRGYTASLSSQSHSIGTGDNDDDDMLSHGGTDSLLNLTFHSFGDQDINEMDSFETMSSISSHSAYNNRMMETGNKHSKRKLIQSAVKMKTTHNKLPSTSPTKRKNQSSMTSVDVGDYDIADDVKHIAKKARRSIGTPSSSNLSTTKEIKKIRNSIVSTTSSSAAAANAIKKLRSSIASSITSTSSKSSITSALSSGSNGSTTGRTTKLGNMKLAALQTNKTKHTKNNNTKPQSTLSTIATTQTQKGINNSTITNSQKSIHDSNVLVQLPPPQVQVQTTALMSLQNEQKRRGSEMDTHRQQLTSNFPNTPIRRHKIAKAYLTPQRTKQVDKDTTNNELVCENVHSNEREVVLKQQQQQPRLHELTTTSSLLPTQNNVGGVKPIKATKPTIASIAPVVKDSHVSSVGNNSGITKKAGVGATTTTMGRSTAVKPISVLAKPPQAQSKIVPNTKSANSTHSVSSTTTRPIVTRRAATTVTMATSGKTTVENISSFINKTPTSQPILQPTSSSAAASSSSLSKTNIISTSTNKSLIPSSNLTKGGYMNKSNVVNSTHNKTGTLKRQVIASNTNNINNSNIKKVNNNTNDTLTTKSISKPTNIASKATSTTSNHVGVKNLHVDTVTGPVPKSSLPKSVVVGRKINMGAIRNLKKD